MCVAESHNGKDIQLNNFTVRSETRQPSFRQQRSYSD